MCFEKRCVQRQIITCTAMPTCIEFERQQTVETLTSTKITSKQTAGRAGLETQLNSVPVADLPSVCTFAPDFGIGRAGWIKDAHYQDASASV